MIEVAAVTRDQMIEVDRLMIDQAGMSLLQMMENAGRALAEFVMGQDQPDRATVVVGRGGNGGGGLVAARHLSNRGVATEVVLTSPPESFEGVPAHQLTALSMTSATLADMPTAGTDVVVDAIIGYSLQGPPRGQAHDLIEAINSSDSPVVSLDVPSGVDSTSGFTPGVAVMADSTLTLALPKVGLGLSPNTGRLHLADISVPVGVYRQIGVDVPADLFSGSQIIEIDPGDRSKIPQHPDRES